MPGRKVPSSATTVLLRTYHPKPTDFSKLSPRALRQTHYLFVHYPRSPRKAP